MHRLRRMAVFSCAAGVGLLLNVAAGDVTKGNFGAQRPGSSAEVAPGAVPEKKTAKRNSYPYHGFLEKVDPSQQSIYLRGKTKSRVILVSAETKIWQSNRRSSLDELVPGARITGSARKNEAGKEEAISIRFGARTE